MRRLNYFSRFGGRPSGAEILEDETMQTFSVEEIQALPGTIRQEGLHPDPIQAGAFRGYCAGTPGGGCHIGGNFIELPPTETDVALARRPFSMEWKEDKEVADFHTVDDLFAAIREGKQVVLFHLYER